MNATRLLSIAALGLLLVPACSPAEAYCQKHFECFEDDQDLDDDYVATCVESDRALNDILAANKEEDCGELRNKKDAYYACLAGLDCDDYEDELQQPDECEDEFEEFGEAAQDAGNDCFVNSTPTGQE